MKIYVPILALWAAALPAQAAVLDDFNRGNQPTLGPNWTQVYGQDEVLDNQAHAVSGNSNDSLALFNGAASNTVQFDVSIGAPGFQYAAAVMNYSAPNQNYHIGVMSEDNNTFDTIFFTYGTGYGQYHENSPRFTQGHIIASISGWDATIRIETNDGRIINDSYRFDSAQFNGTGIGIALYGDARLDNFAAGVPEPATWAMALAGFGLIGSSFRLRGKRPELA